MIFVWLTLGGSSFLALVAGVYAVMTPRRAQNFLLRADLL